MENFTTLIEVTELRLPLKHIVRHASKARKEGESIWVKISRNGDCGFGEGCPRDYVAGDDLDSSIRWIRDTFSNGRFSIRSIDELKKWVGENTAVIDIYPSAWCAVEMAFLDLLSKEQSISVERMLGIREPMMTGRYSAVLADDTDWKLIDRADRFLIRGISDFKVKLNGDIKKDREKLDLVKTIAADHGMSDIRIRFDANNLWKNKTDKAIDHIKNIGSGFFAVEEPVKAKDHHANSRFSSETGWPVILDESLCTPDDFKQYKTLPGTFIANIKISRVGGLLRAMGLIDELKRKTGIL